MEFMDYKTIGDVYEANDKIHDRFVGAIHDLTEEQASLPTENGKWTVQLLVEHVAIVHHGMTGISAKLLSKAEAEGKTSDGSVCPSGSFLQAIANAGEQKFEAPDIVAPTGQKTIAEALAALEASRENLNALRPKFESIDGADVFFPHPVFGPMNAHDWLILVGGHTARHSLQLLKILVNN